MKGFYGQPWGRTKEGRIILYDVNREEFGIDELECVREPNEDELKDIARIKEENKSRQESSSDKK